MLGAKVTYKWNLPELARLLTSDACGAWVHSEATKKAAEINSAAVGFADSKKPPETPPYRGMAHRGRYTYVGRVRPSTAQGKAIEYKYHLLEHYGTPGRSKKAGR